MTIHPKNSHAWAYSQARDEGHPFVELASFRKGDLPSKAEAEKIVSELQAFGVESRVQAHQTHGGFQVRIDGVANVSKFNSGLPLREWAQGVISEAYDANGRQTVPDGVALLARHVGGTSAMLQLKSDGSAEPKTLPITVQARPGIGSETEQLALIKEALDILHITHGESTNGRSGLYYPVIGYEPVSKIQGIDRHVRKTQGCALA